MTSFDLTAYRVVTAEDIDGAIRAGSREILVREGAIFTPSARDAISAKGLAIQSQAPGAAAPANQWQALFHSPEAETIKAEIMAVGRKLWQRQYVDGNGGNI